MFVRPSADASGDFKVAHRPLGSFEEVEPLLRLCEQGKLYAVEEWIAAGKPIQFPPPEDRKLQRRGTGLSIAVRKGFHSLTELLLANGFDPNGDYYECLSPAVWQRNHELVDLLLRYGTDPNAADFCEVLETCDRALMDRFVAAGIDPCRRNALARGLATKRRPILGFVKQYRDRFPQMQRQIDIALHVFASNGDSRGVALMLWLEGDPYANTPESADEDYEYEGLSNSAFHAAMWSDKPEILAAMLKRPVPPERATDLLHSAAHRRLPQVVKRLLAAGADPNAEVEGYPVLYGFINCMTWDHLSQTEDGVARGLEALELVLKAGAKWRNINPRDLKHIRRRLIDGAPKTVIRVVELMRTHQAFTSEAFAELTRTAGIKRILRGESPPLKRWAGHHPILSPVAPDGSGRSSYWKGRWWQR